MKIILNPDTQDASLRPDGFDTSGFPGCTILEVPGDFRWVGKAVDWDTLTIVDASPPVPAQVTPLQIRKAIRATPGLFDAVEAFKATCTDDMLEAWDFASVVDRNDPLIATAATGLGMSADDVDALFILAATL